MGPGARRTARAPSSGASEAAKAELHKRLERRLELGSQWTPAALETLKARRPPKRGELPGDVRESVAELRDWPRAAAKKDFGLVTFIW